MAARKTPQTKADPAIAALSGEDRAELTRLCESHANVTEIHRWLCDRVPGVPYRSVLAWYNREYPPGENAAYLNNILQSYRGINPTDAHLAALCHVVRMSDLIMQEVNESGLVDLPPSLIGNLVDLLREQRQSAQALMSAKATKDTKALELAGGYRVVEIGTRIAEGSPQAGTIIEVLKGAIAQLEQEVE